MSAGSSHRKSPAQRAPSDWTSASPAPYAAAVKILVTGVSGLVGAQVAEAAARRGHAVIGVAHRWTGSLPRLPEPVRLDLSDPERVTSLVLELFPDAIVNAAAITENPACEADPVQARRLNVELPRTLARLSHHLSARLIQLSTDLVFDGKRAPYAPGSPAAPTNLYASTKAAGEAAVLEAAPDFATVLRLPLVNGNSPGGQRSLHERLFAAWSSGETPLLFEDEIRQPALASDIGDVCIELCERPDLRGTHHWAGSEPLSRADMGRKLAEHFKIPASRVRFGRAADDPRFANRPRNLALDISSLAGVLRTRPKSFDEQLDSLIVPRPARTWFHSLG